MSWKLYHNPNCSKSREALAELQKRGITFEVVEYLKTPLTLNELSDLATQIVNFAELVRTKEELFLQEPFDVTSQETVVKKLLEHPRLLERPILQGNGKAAIGRPLQKILDIL